jgi:hypothetical protein
MARHCLVPITRACSLNRRDEVAGHYERTGHRRSSPRGDRAGRDDAEALVIAPALHKSALRFWLSDADQAIARAQTVQQDSVDPRESEGITATGGTGESEPLAAIADTLEGFPADRIALFIHPTADQAYREAISATAITERFGVPVTAREIQC